MSLVVWGVDPDWSDPLTERTQYLTDVLVAYRAQEQRVVLRTRPRTHLAYRVMPTDRREAAAIEALLYGQQSHVFGVPFWPDAQPITEDAAVGTSTLSCETTYRKFRPGGPVALWRDLSTSEVATVLTVASDSLTLTAPLSATWIADGRTYAIPLLIGRWEGDASLGRLSPTAWELDAAFQCAAAPDVEPADPPIVYGYDVLEVEPNTLQDRVSQYRRIVQLIDGQTGRIRSLDRSGVAISQTTGFLWTLNGRVEIAAYRAWGALRRGRQTPFWLPTWQHDLIQAEDLEAGGFMIAIAKTGYVPYQFPQGARRALCITMLDGSGARYYRRVLYAMEGDTTDTLILDGPLNPDAAIPAGTCMLSFLQLVRLNTDELELVWSSRDVAEVQLECQDVPFEGLGSGPPGIG
jgi:hypothetical protein